MDLNELKTSEIDTVGDSEIEKPITKDKKTKKNVQKALSITGIVLLVILIVLGGTIIFHNVYYESFYVRGQSMYPTLNLNATDENGNLIGEYNQMADEKNYLGCRVEFGIMDTHSGAIDSLKRFDIVITHFPGDNETRYVKRLIALPGEKFYFTDKGDLYVNDQLIEQPIPSSYVKKTGAYNVYKDNPLGSDQYFACGDNRFHSSDCRSVGALKKSMLVGKAVAIEGTCVITANGADQIRYSWPRII